MRIKNYFLTGFLLAVFPLTLGSCGEDEENFNLQDKDKEEVKEEVAEYYVKYVACSKNSYISITGVTVATDKGTQSFNYSGNAKYSWEQTYGPVKKGFRANISVTGNKIGSVEIYCCRGCEPFALKASRNGSGSLQYTIDY